MGASHKRAGPPEALDDGAARPPEKRRWWWLAVVVVAGIIGGWSLLGRGPSGPLGGTAAGYNVLLITLDTTRTDCLGCYGHPRIKTPHIDALARDGVRFTQCTSAAPITLPSHASIMTGTYPFVHGARNNGRFLADEGNVTLAELLKRAGYSTGAEVGAFVLDSAWGIAQGFESYRTGLEAQQGEGRFDRLGSGQNVPADNVCNRAIEWLGRHGKERFFLWTHFFDPHQPWDAPARFGEPYADAQFGAYWGEIAFADEQIGRLLGEIRRMGLDDRTVVVLTADHGEGLLQHEELSHTYYVYDTTMSAPLILWWPGRVPAGRVIDAQVRTVDIAPTLLDLLGLPPAPDAQGQSLLRLIEGATDDLDLLAYGESFAAHEAFGYARLRACRTRDWKYIHAPRAELYNVRNDPGEEVNLIDQHPEVAESLRRELDGLITETAPRGNAPSTSQLDSATSAQLRALGYVGGYAQPDPRAERELLLAWAGSDPKDHIETYNSFLKARGLDNTGQRELAAEILQKLVAAEPSNPGYRSLLATQLRKIGSLDDAAAQYEALLSLQPNNAEARYRLGRVLGEMGRLEESAAALQLAVEAIPNDPNAHVYLALALSKLGRAAEAEQHCRGALELAPEHELTRIELSKLWRIRGLEVEAVELLREGVRRQPNSVMMVNNLAWILATSPLPELRNGAESMRLAQHALRLTNMNNPSVLDTLAAACAELGRLDEAVAIAQKAVRHADTAGSAELAEEIRSHLAVYESGQPCRDLP